MSTLSELEKAKILAASQKLAKAKVDSLREYFDSQIKQLQEQKLIPGPQGPQGEPGPIGQDRKVIVEARGPVGEKGETGYSFKNAKISDGKLHLIREDDTIITAGNVVGSRGGQGVPGEKGEKGEKGEQGERGFIGEQGVEGSIGPRGLIGEQGKKGQRGQRGFIGEQGIPGIQGEQGEQGIQGERGLIGEQGVPGIEGPQGKTGYVGPVGPEGPKGKDGTEVDTNLIKETLENDYKGFRQQITEQVTRLASSAGSFAGSGEVRLEFLDDINRDSVKVNGKFLKYDSSSGKWIGGDAGGADTTANTNAAISNLNTNLTATNTAIRLVDSQRLANTNSAISNLNTNLTATNTAIRLVDSQRLANTNAAISNLNTNLTGSNTAIRSYVDTEVAGIVDSAPETLNTLNELAATINDDASYAAAVTTNLGQKLGATSTVTLTGDVTASSTAFSANAVSLTTTDTNLANTNAAISNLNTNLTATNTAIRLVDSQRLANTNAYIATKANYNNTTLTGTISANGSVGVAGYVLTSAGSGAPAFWDATSGGGSDDDSTYVSKSNSAAQAIASALSLNGANTNILGGTLLVTSNTKFHTGGVSFKGQALDVRFANTAQLANTNSYVAAVVTSLNQRLGETATVALTGDVTASATAFSSNSVSITTAIGSGVVVNADVSSSAALAFSKMENLTTARALVSDGSGDVSVSDVTSTEIGYLDGVGSAIQTQIDTKLASANVDVTSGASSITTTTKDIDLNDEGLVNPNGYLAINMGGTVYKVPYWT